MHLREAYDVLQLQFGASVELARRRYRHLAASAHPDRFACPLDKADAERELTRLNAAMDLVEAACFDLVVAPPPIVDATPPQEHVRRRRGRKPIMSLSLVSLIAIALGGLGFAAHFGWLSEESLRPASESVHRDTLASLWRSSAGDTLSIRDVGGALRIEVVESKTWTDGFGYLDLQGNRMTGVVTGHLRESGAEAASRFDAVLGKDGVIRGTVMNVDSRGRPRGKIQIVLRRARVLL